LINSLTCEPILPEQTTHQYLARSWFNFTRAHIKPGQRFALVNFFEVCSGKIGLLWFEVCSGKIGSQVRLFIINRVPPAGGLPRMGYKDQ
jgi:hypothetical protein